MERRQRTGQCYSMTWTVELGKRGFAREAIGGSCQRHAMGAQPFHMQSSACHSKTLSLGCVWLR